MLNEYSLRVEFIWGFLFDFVSRLCIISLFDLSISFRVDGVRQLTHLDAAIYSARRMEMLEIVEKSLYYLVDRPVVHSELSGLPYMVKMSNLFGWSS